MNEQQQGLLDRLDALTDVLRQMRYEAIGTKDYADSRKLQDVLHEVEDIQQDLDSVLRRCNAQLKPLWHTEMPPTIKCVLCRSDALQMRTVLYQCTNLQCCRYLSMMPVSGGRYHVSCNGYHETVVQEEQDATPHSTTS